MNIDQIGMLSGKGQTADFFQNGVFDHTERNTRQIDRIYFLVFLGKSNRSVKAENQRDYRKDWKMLHVQKYELMCELLLFRLNQEILLSERQQNHSKLPAERSVQTKNSILGFMKPSREKSAEGTICIVLTSIAYKTNPITDQKSL